MKTIARLRDQGTGGNGRRGPGRYPALALLFLLCLAPLGFVSAGAARADTAAPARPGQENRTIVPKALQASDMIEPGSFYVNENLFASNLPILVLELEGGDLLGQNLTAQLTLYDKADGANSLADIPVSTALVQLQERQDYPTHGKVTYSLRLPASGEGAPAPKLSLAGLPESGEWLLRGSSHDKGMLRNGLAYRLGQELLPESTPANRFCEVLFLLNGVYHYEGIHILTEAMDEFYRRLAAPGKEGIVLRPASGRARQADNAVRAGNTYFTVTRLWTDEALTKDEAREIAIDLERLESILYSVSPSTFLTYSQRLDEESAIGFFLLNSIMMNVHDDMVPFVLLKNKKGKFQFIPDWNFDNAIDNEPERQRPLPYERGEVEVESISVLDRRPPVWTILGDGGSIRDLRIYPLYRALDGEKFLWLDSLFLSKPYLSGLYATFTRCREENFSTRHLLGIVDIMALQLGHAIERDWLRWEAEYNSAGGPNRLSPFADAKGVTHNRQTASFEQELVKISYSLGKQAEYLGANIELLHGMSADLYAVEKSGNRQAAYSFLTLAAMAIIIFILSRKL